MNINEYLDYIGDDWSKGWLLRGDTDHNGVWVPFSFLEMCDGNAFEALILAQVAYWSDIDKRKSAPRLSHEYGGHLWIVKTYEEWARELHLKSWTTVRACIARLVENNLIIKETHKSAFHSGNTALFLRLNWEVFGEKIRAVVDVSRDTSHVIPETPDDDISGNTSHIIPEIRNDISGNTSHVIPEIRNDISGNTSHVIPGNTSHVIPGNTSHVFPIYTENTPKNTPETPDESVEFVNEFPRKLGNSFTNSPEIGEGEKEKEANPRQKYVRDALAALSMAKIRFPGRQFQKREQLVEDAIIEYGFTELKRAIHQSQKEKARWWSYVYTKLRAEQLLSGKLTGEDYISGKYADYIEH